MVLRDNIGSQHKAMDDYTDLRIMHCVVSNDELLRLERYVSKPYTLDQCKDAINYLLQKEDNSAGYAEYATMYDKIVEQVEYVVPLVATDLLAKHLKRNWKDGADSKPLILDLGAGTGRNAIHLASNHELDNIEAMDLTQAMLNEAQRRNLYKKYYIANANRELPLESNVYDAAMCVGGLAMKQIRAMPAIGNLVRITKPGGLVVITAQSAGSEYSEAVEQLTRQGAVEVLELKMFIGIQTTPDVQHRGYALRVL